MKILSMRRGYDGGRSVCGPVEGSACAELMLLMDDGTFRFVLVTQMDEFEKACVSSTSLFDIMLHSCDADANVDAAMKAMTNASEELYDYEIFRMPEELTHSAYLPAVKLARLALQACPIDELGSVDTIKEFISNYRGVALESIYIPDIGSDGE